MTTTPRATDEAVERLAAALVELTGMVAGLARAVGLPDGQAAADRVLAEVKAALAALRDGAIE